MACSDFKVKCVRFVQDATQHFTVGKVYDVTNSRLVSDDGYEYNAWVLPMNGNGDFEALKKWFEKYYEFELVEDKKVFTKKDLKNGDVVVLRNGDVEIAIVDRGVLITKDGWNRLDDYNADLTFDGIRHDPQWDIMKVYRPAKNWQCQFNASSHGELVYDRERDTKKPRYNGKVVCIENTVANQHLYTVGKIYQFKDGVLTADDGWKATNNDDQPFSSFEEWSKFSSSKWIEIKE